VETFFIGSINGLSHFIIGEKKYKTYEDLRGIPEHEYGVPNGQIHWFKQDVWSASEREWWTDFDSCRSSLLVRIYEYCCKASLVTLLSLA
jgi:hypothetical protein